MKMSHGGDILSFEKVYGRKPLDFSASLNPLGMPEGVLRAVLGAVSECCGYPDPYSRRLSAALAQRLGISAYQLIFGNGSAELMYLYVLAAGPKTALLPVPCFSEYEGALCAAGCEISFYELSESDGFALDEGILQRMDGADVLFLCQPNNPTGQLIDENLLDRILEKSLETGTRIFLDECFLNFVKNGEALSKKTDISKFQNLFILGSFTKLYGMAGLRLGYGFTSDLAMLEVMNSRRQPWSVSALAQAAGLAALGEDDYVKASMQLIDGEKIYLKTELFALGITCIYGEANYLFFMASPDLGEQLARRGILIRDCSSFRGLGAGFYRIAIKTRSENERLLAAMKETL